MRHDTCARYCSIVSTQQDRSLLAFQGRDHIICTPRKLSGDRGHQMATCRTCSLIRRFLCQGQPNGALLINFDFHLVNRWPMEVVSPPLSSPRIGTGHLWGRAWSSKRKISVAKVPIQVRGIWRPKRARESGYPLSMMSPHAWNLHPFQNFLRFPVLPRERPLPKRLANKAWNRRGRKCSGLSWNARFAWILLLFRS